MLINSAHGTRLLSLLAMLCLTLQVNADESAVTTLVTQTDPTQPASYLGPSAVPQVYAPDGIRLSAIIARNGNFYAVVNNTIVSVGEMVAGWQLLDISAENVTMLNTSVSNAQPEQYSLRPPTDIKKKVTNE